MKLYIISLPWSQYDRPSAALGALKAFVQTRRPDIDVECIYAYLATAERLGWDVYEALSQASYDVGELLYAQIVYPQQSQATRELWSTREQGGAPPGLWDIFTSEEQLEGAWDDITGTLCDDLDALANSRDWSDSVIGLTTNFGQLFANIALAQRIKARCPNCTIIFGGSTISSTTGVTVLRTYADVIDYIIQGEGEQPLVALLDHLNNGCVGALPAAVLAHDTTEVSTNKWEVANLDDLPIPNFDEYIEQANEKSVEFQVSIEGSRGCWWDRSARKRDSICYFCNLNINWGGYREKSAKRLADEMQVLSDQCERTDFFFLDNIIRANGVEEMAAEIKRLPGQFTFFYEARANISQSELLALWEVGLRSVQFGIEGLSTSLLSRFNKGTTTLQNLEIMKTLRELGIKHYMNMIAGFPGTTEREVEETIEVIDRYAIAFEPPMNIMPFYLGRDNVVHAMPERFGISNVRNRDMFARAIPADVFAQLELFEMDFDYDTPAVSWRLARQALRRWRVEYERSVQKGRPLIRYFDGGSFLRIDDDRAGSARASIVLRGVERELYLWCAQSRDLRKVAHKFCTNDAEQAEVDGFIERMIGDGLMFREGKRVLAMACAGEPHLAAARIREQTAQANSHRPRILKLATV